MRKIVRKSSTQNKFLVKRGKVSRRTTLAPHAFLTAEESLKLGE